jgi:hypothetical protein
VLLTPRSLAKIAKDESASAAALQEPL